MRANYDFSQGKRGAIVQAPKGKTRITIRLDDDILNWFRARAIGGARSSTCTGRAEATARAAPIAGSKAA